MVGYSAAASACEKGQQWKQAARGEVAGFGGPPPMALEASISSCGPRLQAVPLRSEHLKLNVKGGLLKDPPFVMIFPDTITAYSRDGV